MFADKKSGKGKDRIDDEDITFQRMVAKVSESCFSLTISIYVCVICLLLLVYFVKCISFRLSQKYSVGVRLRIPRPHWTPSLTG